MKQWIRGHAGEPICKLPFIKQALLSTFIAAIPVITFAESILKPYEPQPSPTNSSFSVLGITPGDTLDAAAGMLSSHFGTDLTPDVIVFGVRSTEGRELQYSYAQRLISPWVTPFVRLGSEPYEDVNVSLATAVLERRVLGIDRFIVATGSDRPSPESVFLQIKETFGAPSLVHLDEYKSELIYAYADGEFIANLSLDGIGTEEGVVFVCGTDELAAFHSPKNHGVFPRKWIVLNSAFGERSGHGDVLSAKTVGIVGVGSVGSKLAETLLRSGIRNFVLADGDVFLPENLERHVLDWRDVGFRKVHAMKRRLLQIYNGANVIVVDSNLNWQLSASYQATIVDCFSDCELLIDASGDEATSRFLGALADYNKTPFLSAKVFEGGFGCLIARAVPEIDANYSDGYGAYVAFCNEQGKVPPSTGHRPYEAISEEGTPVVADDAAVTTASGHTARVAIDILDPEVSLGPNAWLLVGLKKEWIFDGHCHIWQLDVGGPTKPADGPKPELHLTEFQKELLEGISGETNDTP